ncbi:axin-1-like [Sardina pilchardus]|uniref:axin-1-like n=1 Tax=Sardina pilchardus TaxID=27697 RepID=UPI002E13248B
MSVRIRSRHADLGGHFNEDAPRPPVPGMEGDTMASPLATHGRPLCHHSFYPTKGGSGGGGNGGSSSGGGSSFGGDSYRGLHDGSVSVATPRRSDLDLGYEPEGSASPTPPYLRWAESLHSLLDDEDGIQLFRAFLCQEGCGDLLDFWFACSGFRKLPGGSSQPASGTADIGGGGGGVESGKRLKLAKAIYRKYIADGSVSVAARQIKPATRTFIRDCVSRARLDAALFDQAQTEVQAWMEENTYPLFLKSDVYLKHAREHGSWGGNGGNGAASRGESSPLTCGGEDTIQANGKAVAASLSLALLPEDSAAMAAAAASAPSPLLPGYLPTLMEDKEWERTEREAEEEAADQAPVNRLTRELLMETAPHRATGRKPQDGREFRHVPWREPVNPYYVNTGYARAPATSANDSEQQSMSSDADTISLTDSSVDGIPPYRYRKHHRKEMQESAKVNGRVPLPHIPRTHRLPKDVHVEPQKFALELISRLETVQREREAQDRLEERLRRVRMEEEGDDADVSVVTSVPSYGGGVGVGVGVAEDDAERILDEHVQRVMKTPGCHSPRSPPHAHAHGHAHPHVYPPAPTHAHKHPYHLAEHEAGWNGDTHHYGSSRGRSYGDGVGAGPPELMGYGSKGSSLSRRGLKPKAEVLKGEEGRGLDGRSVEPPVPVEEKIMQWMMEGESSRHKKSSYSGSGSFKRSQAVDLCRPGPGPPLDRSAVVGIVGLGAGGVPMVPHGWSGGGGGVGGGGGGVMGGVMGMGVGVAGALRGVQPSHPFIQDPTMPPNPAPNPLTQLEEARRRLEEERRRNAALQAKQRHKSAKRPLCENVTVAYYFCGEPIPYRTSVKGRVVTLGQFKELLTKKGAYRFYFKKVSDEFDCGVVFEEVREDDAILPIFEERIIGKVEKID